MTYLFGGTFTQPTNQCSESKLCSIKTAVGSSLFSDDITLVFYKEDNFYKCVLPRQ